MHVTVICLLFVALLAELHACEMPDSSVVYFKQFSIQTILPITKREFNGVKTVIKNEYLKALIDKARLKNRSVKFFENIRIIVNFNDDIYYFNYVGDIELNNSVIGRIDFETINHLDSGFDLYEWKTCRPLNEVLAVMLEEHKRHVEELMKKRDTIIYKKTNN